MSDPGRILVVNPGSSSVKVDLLDSADHALVHEQIPAPGGRPDDGSLAEVLQRAVAAGVDGVAVRVVHGGPDFAGPTVVDAAVRDRIAALSELAPLHQGPAVAALDRIAEMIPDVAVVACFDTTFHRTMPRSAATYAVPRHWRERLKIRRYGFHGLAHEWNARAAGAILHRPVERISLVSAHLGSGSSLCAVRHGRSVDTTMGLTPLSGLVMGTRSGDVDPNVPGFAAAHGAGSPADVATALERSSGLLALAGTADAAEIARAAARGSEDALLAVAVWGHRVRAGIAAMVAALDGDVDALVFSGGLGENSAVLRAEGVDRLAWMGLRLDGPANIDPPPDSLISPAGAHPAVLIVHTREEIVAAGQARAVLGRPPAS